MSSTLSEYIAGGEEAVLETFGKNVETFAENVETFGENVETFDGDFAHTLAFLEMNAAEVHNAINESVEEASSHSHF